MNGRWTIEGLDARVGVLEERLDTLARAEFPDFGAPSTMQAQIMGPAGVWVDCSTEKALELKAAGRRVRVVLGWNT